MVEDPLLMRQTSWCVLSTRQKSLYDLQKIEMHLSRYLVAVMQRSCAQHDLNMVPVL